MKQHYDVHIRQYPPIYQKYTSIESQEITNSKSEISEEKSDKKSKFNINIKNKKLLMEFQT